jgi:hypothetical protein
MFRPRRATRSPAGRAPRPGADRPYLQRLAALARQGGDPDRAVRLLAAADALLQTAGTGWLLAYVAAAPSDDDAAGLRSRMGDEAFQQAWAEGTTIGHQRAVEYALHD